jgi:hypothetical protein
MGVVQLMSRLICTGTMIKAIRCSNTLSWFYQGVELEDYPGVSGPSFHEPQEDIAGPGLSDQSSYRRLERATFV